jgi:membrane fusion protein (multidrug efflux system)
MDTVTLEIEPIVEKKFKATSSATLSELPQAATGRPVGSLRSKILHIVAMAFPVIAVATWFWLSNSNRVSTDDAQVDGHIGYVSSRVSGTVLEVPVDNGAFVKAGQLLAVIDSRDYQVKVDQAKAALALAESDAQAAHAAVALTRDTTRSATAQALGQLAAAESDYYRSQRSYTQASTSGIDLARSNIASAQATYNQAQADLERMRPLVAKEEISRKQFDSYTAAERVAAAQLKAAEDQLVAAQQRAEISEQEVATAQAKLEAVRSVVAQARASEQQLTVSSARATSAGAAIEQARANLNAAELQLTYTRIVAPADGEVTRKTAEVGQFTQPGQALMTIVPLHLVWVSANFKETQLARVHPGQRAEVKIDMYGRKIEGCVDSIAGATGTRMSLLPPENASGNFVKVVQRIPVRIVFDRIPDGLVLRPGMNVDVTVYTK